MVQDQVQKVPKVIPSVLPFEARPQCDKTKTQLGRGNPNCRIFPILFSPTMVRALVDGQKTETRRPISSPLAKAAPGDLLGVRETWHATFCDDVDPSRPHRNYHETPKAQRVSQLNQSISYFEAEMRNDDAHRFVPPRWVPSIHMSRWASRITLVVEKCRFCRLQDITDAEAIAGGVGVEPVIDPRSRRQATTASGSRAQPKKFGKHWDELYKRSGSRLVDNPEVVSLTFSVHHCNVDSLRAQGHTEKTSLLPNRSNSPNGSLIDD